VLLAGRGDIVARLQKMADDSGFVDAQKGDGKRYIVQSDELLSAFLELEAMLL